MCVYVIYAFELWIRVLLNLNYERKTFDNFTIFRNICRWGTK